MNMGSTLCCARLLRNGRAKQVAAALIPGILALCFGVVHAPAAESEPSASQQRISFLELLAVSGVTLDELKAIPAEPNLTPQQREVVLKCLFRLQRMDSGAIGAASKEVSGKEPLDTNLLELGAPVTLKGRAVGIDHLSDPRSIESSEALDIYRLRLQTAEGEGSAVVWCGAIPERWPVGEPLNERVSVPAVYLGRPDEREPVFLSSAPAWHPDDAGTVPVNGGLKFLGELGMDVRKLDAIVSNTPLLSVEHDAFYELFAALDRVGTNQLVRAARSNLKSYAEPWLRVAQEPAMRERDPVQRQRHLIAKAVEAAYNQGQFSVAPLFLDAKHQRGELVLLRGTARRAIRIETNSGRAANRRGDGQHGLDHYYELEIFTKDSQNLPLVCCVLQLPNGFPQGDEIHEPVQVAGFLFKKWRYETRRAATDSRELGFATDAAPLLLCRAAQWIEPLDTGAQQQAGWIAGTSFVAVLIMICAGVWWASRGDRRFERRVAGTRHGGRATFNLPDVPSDS